jgi:15-cis-phytoene synthase
MIEQSFDRIWERTLLRLAQEAYESAVQTFHPKPWAHADDLERSYNMCAKTTAGHSRSFYLASGLLPVNKRRAVRALYAFCRLADDIVDEGKEPPLQALHDYKARTLSAPSHEDEVALAWADARSNYRIPIRYAEQLLEGIERDLHQARYNTFEDLAVYCYGVASTVGLMSMHIIGFEKPSAIAYAVKLGVALQLTNILRDVAEDWRSGRLYLPLEELDLFGLHEDDIENQRLDERWRSFMRYQIWRNRQLYREANAGIKLLNKDGRLAVAAASTFYEGILDDIETHDYDVFTRRSHLTAIQKLRRLPSIFHFSL